MEVQKTNEELLAELALLQSDKEASDKRAAEAETAKIAAEEKAAKAQAEADNIASTLEAVKAVNEELSSKVEAAAEEAAKSAPVSFETDDAEYEFTCPSFTWDDGRVINVREQHNEYRRIQKLEEDDVSKSEKEFAEEWEAICGHLVNRGSGIIRRKED
jgi:hypothetical protein